MSKLKEYFKGFFDVVSKIDTLGELETAERWVVGFYAYIDSLAAANPHRFHHVYEWGEVGNHEARLFELNVTPMGIGTFISYEFKQSVTPNENGQVFADKASVMESGQIVQFTTQKAVPIDQEEFRTGQFTFKPGGNQTTGSFGEAFITYFGAKTVMRPGGNITIRPKSISNMGGRSDGARLYDHIIGK